MTKESPSNSRHRGNCIEICACVDQGRAGGSADSRSKMWRCADVFRLALFLVNLALRYSLPEEIRIGKDCCPVLHITFWRLVSNFYFLAGGLFESFDDDREMAFRYAVHKINADDTLLPNSRLSTKIERLKPQSSFHAAKSGIHFLSETYKF